MLRILLDLPRPPLTSGNPAGAAHDEGAPPHALVSTSITLEASTTAMSLAVRPDCSGACDGSRGDLTFKQDAVLSWIAYVLGSSRIRLANL